MSGRIFTIGHGTWMLDGLVQHLRASHVSHLIDVRSSPYSAHQPEFTRASLEKSAERTGLTYVYMGDQLGGRPPHADCYTEGKVSYGKVMQQDFFKKGIARLVESHQQGLTICLLCAEGDPTNCHRTRLIGAALAQAGIQVSHFFPDGNSRTQTEVTTTATAQGTLPL